MSAFPAPEGCTLNFIFLNLAYQVLMNVYAYDSINVCMNVYINVRMLLTVRIEIMKIAIVRTSMKPTLEEYAHTYIRTCIHALSISAFVLIQIGIKLS